MYFGQTTDALLNVIRTGFWVSVERIFQILCLFLLVAFKTSGPGQENYLAYDNQKAIRRKTRS
jgi:hypothetical protein